MISIPNIHRHLAIALGSMSALVSSCMAPVEPVTPATTLPSTASLSWSVLPADAGTVLLSPEGGHYPKGTLVQLVAQPSPGKFFNHWEGGIVATTPQVDWIASADQTVTAVFGDQPRLTLESLPALGGMTTSSPGPGYVSMGSTVTVVEAPADGYLFDHWEVDGQVTAGTTATTLEVTMAASHGVKAFYTANEWTILLYVAGGNDLAPQALATLKQLESVDLRNSHITVLALVDRSGGYDSAWSGTRLYQVQYDATGQNSNASLPLESVELGLSPSATTNLDMGDPDTLKKFIRSARTHYSAAHYGIVFWGHGTGWRSLSANSAGARALGVDDDNGNSLMYTTELGQGLSAIAEGSPTQKFGFIGMDLCFGAMIETLAEVKGYGEYFVGSEGLVPTNGWRYDLATKALRDSPDRNPFAGALTFFDAFKTGYSAVPNVNISVVDLSKVDTLVGAWNDWSTQSSIAIGTSTQRSAVRKALFLNTTGFYTTPGDLNLDMNDAAVQVQSVLTGVQAHLVTEAISNAVKLNFVTGTVPASGIAIHFVPLDDRGGYSLPFDDGYVQGSAAPNTPVFVTGSKWVPNTAGTGLLDVIWNKVF